MEGRNKTPNSNPNSKRKAPHNINNPSSHHDDDEEVPLLGGEESRNNDPNSEVLTLKVKCSSSSTPSSQHQHQQQQHKEEVEVRVRSYDTIHQLKNLLLPILNAEGKNLRLIASGKLLNPDHLRISEFGLQNGSYIHAVITPIIHPPNSSSRYSHTPNSSSLQANVPRSYRGFDRLVEELGFSLEETAALRSSFLNQVNSYALNHPPLPQEDPNSYRYRMEEEWIASASQDPSSEYSLNLPNSQTHPSNTLSSLRNFYFTPSYLPSPQPHQPQQEIGGGNVGSVKDFIWGFLCGFGFGILMLFCMWDRNVSSRQKLGILCGVLIQLLFSLHQHPPNPSPNSSLTYPNSNNNNNKEVGDGNYVQTLPI